MPVIQMVIEYNTDTDACQVTGPIPNKGACYAMLEHARRIVDTFDPEQAKPAGAIEIARGPIPPVNRLNGRGG